MKYKVFLFFIIVINIDTIIAKPIYESINIGMPIKNLSKIYPNIFIEDIEVKKVLTSYGVNEIDTVRYKKYIKLRNKFWCGLLVEHKNNLVKKCTFQSKEINGNKLIKKIFYQLYSKYGPDFRVYDFQSFTDRGYSLIWESKSVLVKLNFCVRNNNKYQIFLEKNEINDFYLNNDISKRFFVDKIEYKSDKYINLLSNLIFSEEEL